MVLLLSLLLLPVSLLRFLSLRSKQRTEGEEGSEEPTVNGVRNRSLENASPLALISSKNPVETGSRGEPKIEVGARSRLATTKKKLKMAAMRGVPRCQKNVTAALHCDKTTPKKVHLSTWQLRARALRTSLSSSSRVNSFFLTTLSWLRKLNSAAFFCSLANLFSYLETFFSVGLTLCERVRGYTLKKIYTCEVLTIYREGRWPGRWGRKSTGGSGRGREKGKRLVSALRAVGKQNYYICVCFVMVENYRKTSFEIYSVWVVEEKHVL